MTWWRKETLDLLALWGNSSVQHMLKHSRRNLNYLGEIADGIVARVHRR